MTVQPEESEKPAEVEMPHWHDPFKGFDGTIYCSGCDLAVPPPRGMPNYDGAAMGDW